MSTDLPTPQVSELPDYNAEQFRAYAAIMAETFAVLDSDNTSAVDIPAKTADDLQWHDLRQALARHCLGEEARITAERLPALMHRESVARRLREVEEATRLITNDVSPPLQGLQSIARYLNHATRGGVLDGEQLLAVARTARVVSSIHAYFASRAHLAPLLAQVGDDLQTTPGLIKALEHAFEPSGRLADHASPDLGGLRRRVQNYHSRLHKRLDGYLKNQDFQNFLQDDFYTQRGDRYVLPIRAGEKGNVPGIVHGTSGSGQTLFIEPTELVEMNNDLQLAQLEVEEEERRILARLTDLVARDARKLGGNVALLSYIDLTVAKARIAVALHAHRPALSKRGALDLRQARHPMLVLRSQAAEESFEVIANDIHLGLMARRDGEETDTQQQALIISGPNTGGKTVTLKTIGLCCLMTRAGLHIPALPGSEVPLVDELFTDIGDEQSIERDLSTFSGHVANINSFIEKVGPRSLVLLDELFAGTDPEQGVALATALLEHIADSGALVAVTTHLESLKTLAVQHGRFANASVGFDIQSLSPTYRLSLGLPGSSYAIRIARRLGLPSAIVKRAEAVAETTGAADVEKVIRQLERQQARLEKETRRAQEIRVDVQKIQRQYAKKLESIREREMGLIHKETRKLMEEVDVARDAIRDHIKALQETNAPGALTHQQVEAVRAEVEEVAKDIDRKQKARETDQILEERARAGQAHLVPGARVWVKTFKRAGEIVDVQKDRATVRVGGIKATVTHDELFALRDDEQPTQGANNFARGTHQQPSSKGTSRADLGGGADIIPPQHEGNTVDLRGMRVDDALERLEVFLDAIYRVNEPGIYIIHGHGTGALRNAVRAALPASRYIRRFRPGRHGEGGDGVTVAFLT